MSQTTAPEAISAAEGTGKFPTTDAMPVDGATAAICTHEVVRFFPPEDAAVTSNAPIEISDGSVAAMAASTKPGVPDILNFSGLSFKRAKFGFPAE